jgi:hypothetical protein
MEIEEYIKTKNFRQVNQSSYWQELRLWLRHQGFSLAQYDNLTDNLKQVLKNCIYETAKPTSEAQRIELMGTLLSVNIAGRKTDDPVELILKEEIRKLRPLSKQERDDTLNKC